MEEKELGFNIPENADCKEYIDYLLKKTDEIKNPHLKEYINQVKELVKNPQKYTEKDLIELNKKYNLENSWLGIIICAMIFSGRTE